MLGDDRSILLVLTHLFSTRPCLERPRDSLAVLEKICSLKYECGKCKETFELLESTSGREKVLKSHRHS